MKHAYLLAVYLAFGFTFMVIFGDPLLTVVDAWFWVWLAGWPIVVGLTIVKWVAYFFAAILALACVIVILAFVVGFCDHFRSRT